MARSIVGAVFALAGLAKIADPIEFFRSLLSYQEFLEDVIPLDHVHLLLTVSVVPAVEITVGVCLLMTWYQRAAIAISMIMLTLFGAINGAAWLQQYNVSCGCLGGLWSFDAAVAFQLDIVLLVLAACSALGEQNESRGKGYVIIVGLGSIAANMAMFLSSYQNLWNPSFQKGDSVASIVQPLELPEDVRSFSNGDYLLVFIDGDCSICYTTLKHMERMWIGNDLPLIVGFGYGSREHLSQIDLDHRFFPITKSRFYEVFGVYTYVPVFVHVSEGLVKDWWDRDQIFRRKVRADIVASDVHSLQKTINTVIGR